MSWGPDERRAAISLTFEGLAEGEGRTGVSPALPTLLQALGERGLPATFFVAAPVIEAEPLALTMIEPGGNEIALLAADDAGLAAGQAALEATGRRALGARPAAGHAGPSAAAAAGLRYVAPPADELSDAAFLLGDAERPVRGPQAWHEAVQIAVADTLRDGGHRTLTATPGLLERRDALAVFVEVLELVEGLRRAERLWVPTLAALAGA